MDLLADIGATNTRCALADAKGQVLLAESFRNDDFAGVADILLAYLGRRRQSDQPRRAALGVAAPVGLDDEIKMINRDWHFSQSELQQRLSLSRLIVVNDFAAVAHSLPHWRDSELTTISAGASVAEATRCVLGPGSGLGMAAIVPGPEGWNVAAGEGGHVTLPARNDAEEKIIQKLREQLDHVSAEKVISGPGLMNLYRAVAAVAGRNADAESPAAISAGAETSGDVLAKETMAHFFRFLGTVTADLALVTGATGGVYLAGGILPKLKTQLLDSDFRNRFEDKGRYRDYLRNIPVHLITDPFPAFKGLLRLLGYR